MFVPIHDENPLRSIRFQWVTLSLLAINAAVFIGASTGVPERVFLSFALVPIELFDQWPFEARGLPQVFDEIDVREMWTLLTYQFVHVDAFHFVGNMLFLWVFGDNVEDDLGHGRFLLFYLACGVAGGIAHLLLSDMPEVPLIGASGAISGVVSAYVLLHPRVRLWVLLFKFIPIPVTAAVALGLWIIAQFAMPFLAEKAQIAWWAHIGGIIAGSVLVWPLRRPGLVPPDGRPTQV
ncbi:MAG: rhomboid family intramembrane serine protease [Hyphomicrobiaceae bacterium]|nr:MAG: rhomboid family intramembrane serine protease [Hyphomicrobiaceae bacterium]